MGDFSHEFVTSRIVRIRDVTQTAAYLLLGVERLCLLDTGCGIGSLRSYLSEITSRRVDLVILTHGHLDHAGGAGEFADLPICLHPADRPLMRRHNTPSSRMEFVRRNNHITVSPDVLVPQYDETNTLPLSDGQFFDLGGLTLEIIHTPGHTQGMCMVLLREERTILFGDGCGVMVLLLDDDASDVDVYLNGLHKVKTLEPRYDRILRNHGTCISPKELLDNVMDCCRCVLNGTDDHIPVSNVPLPCDRAYLAKKIKPGSFERTDDREGNLVYSPSKIPAT